MNNRIAFLGAGLMGAPIIRRLVGAHHDVTIWNRTAAKVDPLVEIGAKAASTPADAVRGAYLTFLCLSDSAAVSAALFGPGGAAQGLGDTRLIVDLSTIGPIATRAFAQRISDAWDARWVDAPVTGGVSGAENGSLIALCGGDEDDVIVAGSLLRHFCNEVRHLGPLGNGQTAKLCNQLIVSTNILAIRETLALADINGLSPQMLAKALANGWADSRPLQIVGRRMAEQLEDPPILKVQTLAKDISLVVASGGEAHGLPLSRSVERLYAAAIAQGLGDRDIAALRELRRTAVEKTQTERAMGDRDSIMNTRSRYV